MFHVPWGDGRNRRLDHWLACVWLLVVGFIALLLLIWLFVR
jgi:hypothetical protein